MELIIDKPELRVFYCSDLHSDFWKYSVAPFFDRVKPEDYDLFLFPGDVGEWVDGNAREIYETILAAGKPIIMVPGNHEFYRSEYQLVHEGLAEFAEKHPNFFYLECNFVDLPVQKTRIWGDTFWTDFQGDDKARSIAARYMNDYRQIFFRRGHGDIYLTPEDTVKLNTAARKSLIEQTKDLPKGWNLIVMTHHAPFRESTPKSYKKPEYTETAKLNKAYSNELFEWCERNAVHPDVWLHGHIHERANYVVEWDDRMCIVQSNPFGYPGQQDHDAVKNHHLRISKNGITVV